MAVPVARVETAWNAKGRSTKKVGAGGKLGLPCSTQLGSSWDDETKFDGSRVLGLIQLDDAHDVWQV